MRVLFVLLVVLHGVVCAASMVVGHIAPGVSSGVMEIDQRIPGLSSDFEVEVLYKPFGKELCYVRWDIYGRVNDSGLALTAVLERNLLRGNPDDVIDGSEIYDILSNGWSSLRSCLRDDRGVSFSSDRRRLYKQHFDEMFPSNAQKVWNLLPAGCEAPFFDGEVRVLFSLGGYSCKPTLGNVPHQRSKSDQGSRLAVQRMEEVREPFVTKLCVAAEERLRSLEVAMQADARIVVQYCDVYARLSAVVWDGQGVLDSNNCSIGKFLRRCVMLGTSFGYKDEDAIKHYAFTSQSLTRGVLETFLSFDIMQGVRVKTFRGDPMLSSARLNNLPSYGWFIGPVLDFLSPFRPNAITVSFGGVRLEGIPIMPGVRTLRVSYDRVFPRSFLWGLKNHAERRGSDDGPHIHSERLVLGSLGKAVVQFQFDQEFYQVRWDIRGVFFKEKPAEEVLIDAFRSFDFKSDVDGKDVQSLLEQELPRRLERTKDVLAMLAKGEPECVAREGGMTYFSAGNPLCIEQFADMFPAAETKRWRVAFKGSQRSLCSKEVRVLFCSGSLVCSPAPNPAVMVKPLPECHQKQKRPPSTCVVM